MSICETKASCKVRHVFLKTHHAQRHVCDLQQFSKKAIFKDFTFPGGLGLVPFYNKGALSHPRHRSIVVNNLSFGFYKQSLASKLNLFN